MQYNPTSFPKRSCKVLSTNSPMSSHISATSWLPMVTSKVPVIKVALGPRTVSVEQEELSGVFDDCNVAISDFSKLFCP